jgi:hypothetical protein
MPRLGRLAVALRLGFVEWTVRDLRVRHRPFDSRSTAITVFFESGRPGFLRACRRVELAGGARPMPEHFINSVALPIQVDLAPRLRFERLTPCKPSDSAMLASRVVSCRRSATCACRAQAPNLHIDRRIWTFDHEVTPLGQRPSIRRPSRRAGILSHSGSECAADRRSEIRITFVQPGLLVCSKKYLADLPENRAYCSDIATGCSEKHQKSNFKFGSRIILTVKNQAITSIDRNLPMFNKI